MVNETMSTAEKLTACPFCGAGETRIEPNGRMWTGMGWSEPVSVSVRHWCTAVAGQPSRMIERVGRDEASAIAAWNRRAQPAADGAQRVGRMSEEQESAAFAEWWLSEGYARNALDSVKACMYRHAWLARAAWGVKLDGEGKA